VGVRHHGLTPLTLPSRAFVVGGAGFIGGHFVDRLLADAGVERVTVYDNFSSGREWHLAPHRMDGRLCVMRGDVKDLDSLTAAMRGHDVVIHLASNPDIARAVTEPAIDFHEGTLLSHNVVEAMRLSGTCHVLYASGSGIYGDLGETEAGEDFGPLRPISTYGASKLAGEALFCSYCHMFDLVGRAFRFGNVVGPRQTHGVGFDFLRQLLASPKRLRILGDGGQSKSYIHVQDVVDAVLLAYERAAGPFDAFNVATGDYVTVREIADLAVECTGAAPAGTEYEFTGGDRGWRGDVPVVRLDTSRIRRLGWCNRLSSREALRQSMLAMLDDARTGRLW
jgi:UDP-glucose 4-epimerase